MASRAGVIDLRDLVMFGSLIALGAADQRHPRRAQQGQLSDDRQARAPRSQPARRDRHRPRDRPVPRDQPPGRRAAHAHAARSDRGPAVHARRTAPGRCWPRSRSRSICASTTPSSSTRSGPISAAMPARRGAARASTGGCRAARSGSSGSTRQPFSPEEDLAVAEGLEGLPISDDGTLAYFGLTGRNSTDDHEVIGYLAPERANFLEYDLTRMINDLAQPDKPVVAVLGDLPLMGGQINQLPARGRCWRRCTSSSTCASSAASRRRSRTTSRC